METAANKIAPRDPTTLDAALDIISQMRAAIDALETQIEDLEEAECELTELRGEIEEFEMADELLEDHLDVLALTWRAIKDGRPQEALCKLEGVLGDLDSAWRTRT